MHCQGCSLELFFLLPLLISICVTSEDEPINWQRHKPKYCIDDDNFTYTKAAGIRVYVSVSIRGIYDIREDQMELTMQLFLYEFWFDPTLELEKINISVEQRMPNHFSRCIWTPDIFIRNEKVSSLYDITSINQDFKVFPDGTLYRYSRYRVTLDCPMDFRLYPMDVQTCVLYMSLFSSKNNDARLSWMGEEGTPPFLVKRIPAASVTSNVQPLQFTLSYPPKLRNYNLSFVAGNSTILECSLEFHRHITAGLVNMYIPSFFVVCLSFVSFWIDVKAIPGRVTLGVTALLTLATQIVHARSGLPDVEYLSAMDVWLFGCLVMVFLSLIEFTLAHSSYQRDSQMNENDKTPKTKYGAETHDNENAQSSGKRIRMAFEENNSKIKRKTASASAAVTMNHYDNKFDRIARFLFPVSALTLFAVYCIYYLCCANSSKVYDPLSLRRVFL